MKRLLYYSQLRCESGSEFRLAVDADMDTLRGGWTEQGLSEVSIFVLDLFVFVYAEAISNSEQIQWNWPQHYSLMLEIWPPDPLNNDNQAEAICRLAVPLIDVFHDGVPSNPASWRGDRQIDERIGSIARLKTEKVSSYIFYHYQKQEESTTSFNQTYMIGALGTWLFSYHELPGLLSEQKPQGLLNTQQSPVNWHEVMLPHFEPWEDAAEGPVLWRRMERINGSCMQ